jgi:hypothetical protein
MATGFIGTSRITSPGAGILNTGTTLSYTCPSSSVSYAVVSINASVTACAGPNDIARARAGTCTASAAAGSASATSITYSIILAPGQTWSDSTETNTNGSSSNLGYAAANLQASVLEVV